MSTTTISSFALAGKQVTIYLGILTLIGGVVGGFLITVVFLSLRTFRQNSCAFYLTIMSVVNIGQMVTGLLARIMDSGYGIDWSKLSTFYCEFRFYCFQVCALTSMTCICLATIDQYLSTCSHPRRQQQNNTKLSRRVLAILILIWMLHNIPYLIYFKHVVSNNTGEMTCVNTNNIFPQFFFGFLAYRNIQQMSHRTLPLARRELDTQLTVMVLMQVISALFTIYHTP